MNELDIEVALKVLEERQRLQEDRLKDVDECCGKLKGSSSQEFRILSERITAIEQEMSHNCESMSGDFRALDERVKMQCDGIEKIEADITDIHKTYRKVTIEFILAVLLGIVALFLHF